MLGVYLSEKPIIKVAVAKDDSDLEPDLYEVENLRRRCVEQVGVFRKQVKRNQTQQKRTTKLNYIGDWGDIVDELETNEMSEILQL